MAGFENQKCNKEGEFHDQLLEDSYSRKLRPYNIHPKRRSIVLLFLVKQVLPEPPDPFLIIGITREILYRHFLFVPDPDDLERCLKDGSRWDQRRVLSTFLCKLSVSHLLEERQALAHFPYRG